jgi:hypothetical protein
LAFSPSGSINVAQVWRQPLLHGQVTRSALSISKRKSSQMDTRRPYDSSTVAAYAIAAQFTAAESLGLAVPFRVPFAEMSDDDLFCRLVSDPAEARIAREREWSDPVRDHDDWFDLHEELDGLYPEGTPPHVIADQLTRLQAASERARAFIADDANWGAIASLAAALIARREQESADA